MPTEPTADQITAAHQALVQINIEHLQTASISFDHDLATPREADHRTGSNFGSDTEIFVPLYVGFCPAPTATSVTPPSPPPVTPPVTPPVQPPVNPPDVGTPEVVTPPVAEQPDVTPEVTPPAADVAPAEVQPAAEALELVRTQLGGAIARAGRVINRLNEAGLGDTDYSGALIRERNAAREIKNRDSATLQELQSALDRLNGKIADACAKANKYLKDNGGEGISCQ
jgi:hypothetical protein